MGSRAINPERSLDRLRLRGSSTTRWSSNASVGRRKSVAISDYLQRKMSSAVSGPQWSTLGASICRLEEPGDTALPEYASKNHREPSTRPLGSVYDGEWDWLGMTGRGFYTMPHGVKFLGDFYDETFKGSGILIYSDGAQMRVNYTKEWNANMNDSTYRLARAEYAFKDDLKYSDEDWEYCVAPDRRFYIEQMDGLNPACTEKLTQRQPTPVLPPGCYDTGDGVYNHKTRCVTSHDTGYIIRIPTDEESDWIIKNCRHADDTPVGYRPELYEAWSGESILSRMSYGLARNPSSPIYSPPTNDRLNTCSSKRLGDSTSMDRFLGKAISASSEQFSHRNSI